MCKEKHSKLFLPEQNREPDKFASIETKKSAFFLNSEIVTTH